MTGSPIRSENITVLVVDDSAFMRQMIIDILQRDSQIKIVGQSANGQEALDAVAALHPDVISLDLVMPKMDGLETLRRLKHTRSQARVVIVSAYANETANVTLDCLAEGAVDFILKPSEFEGEELAVMAPQLIAKIKAAATSHFHNLPSPANPTHSIKPGQSPAAVVIGSSTGGPVALEYILTQLPADLPFPILVAQHLPAGFVESFVARLAKKCHLPIRTGQDGDIIEPGVVYFAQGDADSHIVSVGGRITLSVGTAADTLAPSVTKLMTSVARVYGTGALGIILTGMGADGLEGMRAIRNARGQTVVQNEQTSVVYGMGRVVAEQGLADKVISLDQIASLLCAASEANYGR